MRVVTGMMFVSRRRVPRLHYHAVSLHHVNNTVFIMSVVVQTMLTWSHVIACQQRFDKVDAIFRKTFYSDAHLWQTDDNNLVKCTILWRDDRAIPSFCYDANDIVTLYMPQNRSRCRCWYERMRWSYMIINILAEDIESPPFHAF